MKQNADLGNRSFLGTDNINVLIAKFAVPSIIALLSSALYNIADQIFIGNSIGENGLSATTYAMPITTLCTGLSLLLGVGTASYFNLQQGKGNRDKASNIACNGIALMFVVGIMLGALILIFLEPITKMLGAEDIVLDYLQEYTAITALSIPFFIFSISFSNIIRSDGSPAYSMVCMLSGAFLNVGLDALFIFGFNWGIKGAAWASVISQSVSALLAFLYLFRVKTFSIKKAYFKLKSQIVKSILFLGIAAFINQIAIMVMQLVLNKVVTKYGGADGKTLVASVGAAVRFNVIVMAFLIGTAQGCQPIVGYNYGAQKYDRVKKTYFTGAVIVSVISVAAFAAFQLIPRPIIMIFGKEDFSELYFTFGVRVFRIFMLLTFVNGIQPLTSNFFTSIGKAYKGMMLSLTRQIIFLLPLVLILPTFLGVDGVLYAGPIADFAAFVLAGALIFFEMKLITKKQRVLAEQNAEALL